jgi:hypothetical protein
MSTFYLVTATHQTSSSANSIGECLERGISSVYDTYAAELARKLQLVERKHLNKPVVVFTALCDHFAEMPVNAVAVHLFEGIPAKYLAVFKNESRLVKSIVADLKADACDLPDVYRRTTDWQTKLYLWQFMALLQRFKPEFAPIQLIETTLEVKSKVFPEGQMPATKTSVRWPQLVSRFMRDVVHDESKNPWLRQFGYAVLASPEWNGHPIYDVWMENRKRTTCTLRFVCEPEWVSHLDIGRTYPSAG